jgi:hypothetical protein
MTYVEREIRTLAKVTELEPKKVNLWKVAFEDYSESHTTLRNLIYKREEEMRSVKNEIYQVVGFFSAFQGLLITVAAQSNLLRCNNAGFVLALCIRHGCRCIWNCAKEHGHHRLAETHKL